MLCINNISKSFSGNIILSDISFCVPLNKVIGIIGPSGCGKSTLLNIMAHLDKQDTGSLDIPSNNSLLLGYMMQDALLLPWRTLEENALLGVEVVREGYNNKAKLLDYFFEAFDLSGFKKSYPSESSAGMKQRVALIRTLLLQPSLLLLDEPFSNLDFDIKLKIQRNLIGYQKQRKTSVFLVTHDIDDAIALCDTVVVLSDKPTKVKSILSIKLGTLNSDPVEARKSPMFREYFIRIWDELKYLK